MATGPKLYVGLPGVLISWQALKYVFVADVEKMYRCINLNEKDAQCHRVLRKPEGSVNIEKYICSGVMFGTSAATTGPK